MAVSSSDFERFLYANFPDDYRRATAKNVPEDVLTAIVSRHSSHYSIWKNIPEWIKGQYNDILPRELLNGNIQVKEFIKKVEDESKKSADEARRLIDFSVSLLAAGYGSEAVKTLSENRALRDQLLQLAAGEPLSAEQLEQWNASRESDREAITRDWQTNQPEKYLFHLMKEMNRSRRRGEAVSTQTQQELNEMMTMFNDKSSRKRLVEYLRQKPQQAALSHMTPESLEQFSGLLKQCGINITPTNGAKSANMEISRESLAASLKKHFQWRVKMEELLKAQCAQRNVEFANVSVRDVLNDGIRKLLPFSSKTKQQEQRA